MKCPRCQQDHPPHAKFCLECGTPLRDVILTERSYADLQAETDGLRRELGEAREQQTATAEILRVISSSPTDIQAVLATVAERAARLCDSFDAAIFLVDGDTLRRVPHHGPIPPTGSTTPLVRGFVNGRVVLERREIHLADLQAETDEFPEGSAEAQRVGWRTTLAVPLMRANTVIGTIAIRRTEVRPFSVQQIDLLKTFANQAVIAIENVRLFNETKEALEQQTATSEILRVISQSQTDVQPVFDTIAANARRLCNASSSAVFTFDGELIHLAAQEHMSPQGAAVVRGAFPMPPGRGSTAARAIMTRSIAQITEARDDPEYVLRDATEIVEFRSVLAVPMLRDGHPIGAVSVGKAVTGPFPDKQIALLQTFADQAVIAVENVRLFTELREKNQALTQAHAQVSEALEQQTATAEVLKVISRSTFDLQPVLDTLIENAARLCASQRGVIMRRDGDSYHGVAFYNVSPELTDFIKRHPITPGRHSITARVALERRTIHVADLQADPEYRYALRDADPIRTELGVPIFRGDDIVGVIILHKLEVQPFTDKQIELVETFADQAVIAIENVRLFNELEARNRDLTEALQQQTATSEILRVISSSHTDLQPVFDAILHSAGRLCDATFGALQLFDGEHLTLDGHYGISPEDVAMLQAEVFPMRPDMGSSIGRAIIRRATVHIEDIRSDPEFKVSALQTREGYRTALSVPMLRGDIAVGVINLWRRDVRPFSQTHIDMVQTFADQAVIAIENVRLFTELQEKNRALTQAHGQVTEALEQQTATSEILRVIASSPTDVQPVFDTIITSAVRLCDAQEGSIFRFDGQLIHLVASNIADTDFLEIVRSVFPRAPGRGSVTARAILTRAVTHVPDIAADPEYEHTSLVETGRRTVLSVPMLKDGQPIGAITVTRRDVRSFPDKQIALLNTFADQAVIAIENVRLFNELQARTQELSRSVEQLTALGEVGRAVSSTLDLETVLTTIVSRAVQLSGLDGGVVFEYDDSAEEFVQRVATETGEALAEARRTTRIRKGEGVLGRTAITLEPVQVPDITAPGAYEGRLREALIGSGIRAILAVPMLREGQLIGCLGVIRNRPGEFPTETIELLRTFATQSALAIQNARLFHEIEDKSRQLEVASQHKSEFLANMSHELRTPLNAVIGFSEVLTERMFGELNEKQDEYVKDIYASGTHLLSLINDILDLSKVEAGRMELELADFHLPQAIENALVLVRERALRRGITLEQSIDPRLGEIQGDERKVKQVLLNLLSNAIKFTPESGRIDVRAKPVNGSVEISVSDTGVGIAAEDQQAIFEEFRQVGTAAKKVEGTGLGLALSRKFIELHGGRIWIESEIGVGSTFTFTLPVRRGE